MSCNVMYVRWQVGFYVCDILIPFSGFYCFHVCAVNLHPDTVHACMQLFKSLRLCKPQATLEDWVWQDTKRPMFFWLQVPGRAINKSKGVPYPCSSLWQGRPASALGSLTIVCFGIHAGSVCFLFVLLQRDISIYVYIYINICRRTSILKTWYFVYLSVANSITVWQVCLCWLSLLFAALKGRYSTCFVSSREGSNTRAS